MKTNRKTLKINMKTAVLTGVKFIIMFTVGLIIERMAELILGGFESKVVQFILNELANNVLAQIIFKAALIVGANGTQRKTSSNRKKAKPAKIKTKPKSKKGNHAQSHKRQ